MKLHKYIFCILIAGVLILLPFTAAALQTPDGDPWDIELAAAYGDDDPFSVDK